MVPRELWTQRGYTEKVFGGGSWAEIGAQYWAHIRETYKTPGDPTIEGVAGWVLDQEDKALGPIPRPGAWEVFGAIAIAEIERVIARVRAERIRRRKAHGTTE